MIFGSSRRNLDFSKLFDYNTPPIWERPQDGPPVTEEMPMPNGPRFGGGSMGNPDGILSLGGYDRNAAMQGQSGFSPMNQGQPAKKPGFFGQGGIGRSIAGTIGDVLLQRNGNAPIYAPAMRQKSELMQRQQMAEQQRQQEREDFIWKSQYERDNPKPANDALTRYMRLGGIDPMSEQGKAMYAAAATNEAYPERAVPFTDEQGNSGLRFIRSGMPPQQNAIQEGATATNSETGAKLIFRNGAWQPLGGGVGNGTSGF